MVLAQTSDKFKQKLTDAERLEHRNAALASITDELRTRIAELEASPEVENLSQEVSVLEEEREGLREYVAKLETDCEELKLRNEELAKRNEQLVQEIEDTTQRTEEIVKHGEQLRVKLADAQEMHENFVTATEDERASNHSSFLNLQTALNEEKEAVQVLEETISCMFLHYISFPTLFSQ